MITPCKICGGDCGQCGEPVTDPSHEWDADQGAYVRRWDRRAPLFNAGEIVSLAVFAAGVAGFVFYIVPRIEYAIAAFDRIIGG
ncbi:MAG: hypothetical protein ACOY3N_23380 [Bradyrhizobium sp.]|uniref:hypothetical protein n=1 Tax=Bradyrhizobium sp. TaxID=376 RepID=UPI003BEFCF09